MITLRDINRQIEDSYRANDKSIFRCSFDLDEETKAALSRSDEQLPYLRIACLLQDFYDYTNGINFRDCWEMHNQQVRVEDIWKAVYGVKISPYEVKSRAWIISGECRGSSSDIWRAIKSCASKKSEDGANQFDPNSYVNDDVPRQLISILEDYQAGGISGKEYVSFIEEYARKRLGGDEWLNKLVDVARQHFPKEANFSAGYYLKWDGPGSETAEIIFGVDHVSGRESVRYSVGDDVKRVTVSAGFKAFVLPPTDVERYKVSYCGYRLDIPASPVGVYCRYVYGRNPRRNWWRKIKADGSFPYYRDELVVCMPDMANSRPNWAATGIMVDEITPERITCAGKKYILYYCKLLSRPSSGVSVDVCGIATRFAGESPLIKLVSGWSEDISAEDAVVVEESARVEVSCVGEDVSCEWVVNGEIVKEGVNELDIKLPSDEACEKRIVATLRKGGRISRKLSINLFYVPKIIADLVRAGKELPEGWCITDDGETGKCIENRVVGKKGVLLEGPGNIILPIKIKDESLAWWYESETQSDVITGEFKEVGQFPRMSDLAGCYLCIPEDLKDKKLELQGRSYRVGNYNAVDGVIRIELGRLFDNCGQHEFRYNGKVSELSLSLDGNVICEVAAVPKKPVLCRDAETNELGVFLPNRTCCGSQKFIVLAYSDSITTSEVYQPPSRITEQELKWKKGEGDQFVSLEFKLQEFAKAKPNGDMFVVLVKSDDFNEYSCLLCNPFFLKDGVNYQLEFVRPCTDKSYSEEEGVAITQLREMWSQEMKMLPDAHPLRKTRFYRFTGRIKYEDCISYWNNAKGVPSQWKQVFQIMLESGFNPLLEPCWFNQNVDDLFAAAENKKQVAKVLLDNQDASNNTDMVRGDGLCSALVAKYLIDAYSSLVPNGCNRILKNREQSILAAGPFERLGVYGVFKDDSGVKYRHVLKCVDAGRMEFSGSGGAEVVERRKGVWKRADKRIGKLVLVGFAFNESEGAVERVFKVKSSDIDGRDCGLFSDALAMDEFHELVTAGKGMAESLGAEWVRRLFVGSFDVFERKGMCDLSIIRVAGLIAVLQSIIASKDNRMVISKQDSIYDLMLRIVRKLFYEKFVRGNDAFWRDLMRIIVAYLGIYAYLGVDVSSVDNNIL